jgi:hypothetical protein
MAKTIDFKGRYFCYTQKSSGKNSSYYTSACYQGFSALSKTSLPLPTFLLLAWELGLLRLMPTGEPHKQIQFCAFACMSLPWYCSIGHCKIQWINFNKSMGIGNTLIFKKSWFKVYCTICNAMHWPQILCTLSILHKVYITNIPFMPYGKT